MLADLHINPRDKSDAEAMARTAHIMGIRVVGLEASDPGSFQQAAKAFEDYGIEVLSRITIDGSRWTGVLRRLRRVWGSFDIVAVKAQSPEVIRNSARDSRVSLVVLTPQLARYMDRSQAQLLRRGGTLLEVQLRPLLYSKDPRRELRGFAIIVRRAVAYEAPLVLSSAATTVYEMWHPRTVASLLTLLGLSEYQARALTEGYSEWVKSKRGSVNIPGLLKGGV
jgi:ribonuclease P/MRP protein subunit RPP1